MRLLYLTCGLAVALGTAGTAPAQDASEDPQTSTPGIIWKRVVPELQEIRRLEDRHDSLPRFAIFGTDRGENREKINALLDQTIRILGVSDATTIRAEIQELYLCGGGSQTQGLRECLKGTLNLPVSQLDPLRKIEGAADMSRQPLPCFAVAIGLAVRSSYPQ